MSLPYQGNKKAIADDLVLFLRNSFQETNNFYDLFGGGGSITEIAIKHFNFVHYNELQEHIYKAFCSLLDGSFKDLLPKNEWITPEIFKEEIKNKTARAGLISTCWSFGNNQKHYLYGSDFYEWKKAVHELIFADNYETIKNSFDIMQNRDFGGYFIKFDESKINELLKVKQGSDRRFLLRKCVLERTSLERLQRLQSLESLERLERLESLESLESLERLERLETSNLSYENVVIKPNSLVYCDIPYNSKTSKNSYNLDYNDFHNNFYKWALEQENAVVFSEYLENVGDNFEVIWMKNKVNKLAGGGGKKSTEVLAWNKKGKFNKSTLF